MRRNNYEESKNQKSCYNNGFICNISNRTDSAVMGNRSII